MAPPAKIAHYTITSKLGEGGMGAVYRAIDTKLNRNVAIKVLPPAFAADSSRMARWSAKTRPPAAPALAVANPAWLDATTSYRRPIRDLEID
jgi:serine/threonine-protein kinase